MQQTIDPLYEEMKLPEYDLYKDELERLAERKLEKGTAHREETLAALKEANSRVAKQFQFDDQDELTKWRPGRIMSLSEFMLKLEKVCNQPKLADKGVMGMVGLSVLMPTKDGGQRAYVCAVPTAAMPEYSQLRIGEHGEATSEKYRGWRTILLRLIEVGATTEEKLNKVFGEPTAYGSGPYLKQVRAMRNAGAR